MSIIPLRTCSVIILYPRSGSPCRDGDDDDDVTPDQEQEVSFSIKRALGSRKGWKIMADDGHSIDGMALKTVVSMIKDMEFQVQYSYLSCKST